MSSTTTRVFSQVAVIPHRSGPTLDLASRPGNSGHVNQPAQSPGRKSPQGRRAVASGPRPIRTIGLRVTQRRCKWIAPRMVLESAQLGVHLEAHHLSGERSLAAAARGIKRLSRGDGYEGGGLVHESAELTGLQPDLGKSARTNGLGCNTSSNYFKQSRTTADGDDRVNDARRRSGCEAHCGVTQPQPKRTKVAQIAGA